MPTFDPALRKTVSCPVLEAAFAKNPHPDGKTMNALAEKLKLNKKQVSNFFERERRKANIVIESRRKGGAGSPAGSSASSSNGSKSGKLQHASSSTPLKSNKSSKATASNSDGKSAVSNRASAAPEKKPSSLPSSLAESQHQHQRQQQSSSLNGQRATRTVAKAVTYSQADEDEENENDEDAEGEEDDYVEDGDYNMEEDDRNDFEDDVDFLMLQQEAEIKEIKQNPLVQKNASECKSRAAGASSRYALNIARYASRSPLYAFPAAQAPPDNFRNAPQPTIRRINSASPALPSRSSSPLNVQLTLSSNFASTKHLTAPTLYKARSRSLSYTKPEDDADTVSNSKRKRSEITPSESPTVLFLRNPFPAPVDLQAMSTAHTQPDDEPMLQHLIEEREAFGGSLDSLGDMSLTQPSRKRARVWFSKPATETEGIISESEPASLSQESQATKAKPSVSGTAQSVSTDTRTTRTALKRSGSSRGQLELDIDIDSSAESDYGEDDISKKKKDNRPGAALRSSIACGELRQAFNTNPHPPSGVLEALAIRLGLGKKQVSNYFVRERKKAGFTIKIRHGLQKRRSGHKKKSEKPALVVTQHDDVSMEGPSMYSQDPARDAEEMDMMMSSMAGEEDDSEDEDEDTRLEYQETSLQSTSSLLGRDKYARDDVPDLSYDDQDGFMQRNKPNHPLEDSPSNIAALMVPCRSMDSMTTSSRQDEDEELTSPAFEALPLPPLSSTGQDKARTDRAEAFLAYVGEPTPIPAQLQLL